MTKPFSILLILFVACQSMPAAQASDDLDAVGDSGVAVTAESPVVIVHGAWGGAHHWRDVDRMLTRDHGFEVRRASLTGLGERSHLASKQIDLKTHIRDVVQLIEFDDLQNVILIGHSYGGTVVTGVVDAIPDRIGRVILIDSNVLENGECHYQHNPESRQKSIRRANEDGGGFMIPVDWKNQMRDTPHPLATLVQPLELKRTWPEGLSTSYWLLCDGKPAEKDSRFRYLQRAQAKGWSTKTLPWFHNPHRARPEDVVAELMETLR